MTVASDKTQRLVAALVSEEFGLRRVFLSGIAQARSARQAARIDVAGIHRLRRCDRGPAGAPDAAAPDGGVLAAGSECRFGLPPESGPGQFDA